VDANGFETWLDQNPEQTVRDRIGEALFEFYVGTLFEHEIYNCDPHPGNYFFQDGQVTILDHGCTRQFEPAFVDDLARLSTAAREGDDADLRTVLADMHVIDPDDDEAFETARCLVHAFYGPVLDDETQRVRVDAATGMQDVLASKRDLMQLDLPGAFLFLFRIRVGLFPVLARIGARANWAGPRGPVRRRANLTCGRAVPHLLDNPLHRGRGRVGTVSEEMNVEGVVRVASIMATIANESMSSGGAYRMD
jgi:hypothetical protein